ncbi:MAG: hypothetical protein V7647_3571 [Acidobacteriota bacterium]
MRRVVLAAAMAGLMASRVLGAGGSITGTYVEARTAEVFAGGCIMNGEAVTTGREALLAWKVTRGSFDGVALNGLAVVAAVAGDTNLGIREFGGQAAETRTALFVDERATPAQRAALVSMARQNSKGVLGSVVETTPTAIQFVDDGPAIKVSAKSLRLSVAREMHHDPTCGGKQWFHPLAVVDGAAMGTTDENAFSGAALGTKWSDPNKRSSFFGTFTY